MSEFIKYLKMLLEVLKRLAG